MAFSDMCQMDIASLAEEHFGGREDLNEAWYAQLLDLATNGCEGAKPAELEGCADGYLDLDVSAEVIRYASTTFFDAELLGAGEGPVDGAYAELTAEERWMTSARLATRCADALRPCRPVRASTWPGHAFGVGRTNRNEARLTHRFTTPASVI